HVQDARPEAPDRAQTRVTITQEAPRRRRPRASGPAAPDPRPSRVGRHPDRRGHRDPVCGRRGAGSRPPSPPLPRRARGRRGRALTARRTFMIRGLPSMLVVLLLVSPAAAADRVKVGFIATFSGPAGSIGQHMWDGFTLGVEHAGGKLGGLTTEVIKEDDQLK